MGQDQDQHGDPAHAVRPGRPSGARARGRRAGCARAAGPRPAPGSRRPARPPGPGSSSSPAVSCTSRTPPSRHQSPTATASPAAASTPRSQPVGARRGRAVVRAAAAMARGLPPAAGGLNRRPPASGGRGASAQLGHEPPHRLRRRRVGREERLDRQLGQRDVRRGPERRHRAQEGQDRRRRRAAAAARRPRRRPGLPRHARRRAAGQRRELVEERGQRGVAGRDDLAAEAVEQVRPPLREVRDARRDAVRVQAERAGR